MKLEWQIREKDSRFPVHYLCIIYKDIIIAEIAQVWKYPEHKHWTAMLGTALSCPSLPDKPNEQSAKRSVRKALHIPTNELCCVSGCSIDDYPIRSLHENLLN